MRLFIASLGMLFAASMIAYVLLRVGVWGRNPPPLGTIHLPWSLWISTFLVLAASFTIHRSLHNVRLERQQPFRMWLAVTLALAILFVIVQTPSVWIIFSEHRARVAEAGAVGIPMAFYGLVFFLIVVHALHVLGGVLTLAWVLYRAGQNAYDHEHHMPVRHSAFYWHFLDVVWMVMFGTMWILK